LGNPETNIAGIERLQESGGHALIDVETQSVGYLCWQPYSEEELAIVGEASPSTGFMDVDIFIGEPAFLNCGVGPRVLRMLLTRLWEDPSVRIVGICTSVENKQALRAFEKAGFSRQRQFDDPDHGPCWFMVARRHDGAV